MMGSVVAEWGEAVLGKGRRSVHRLCFRREQQTIRILSFLVGVLVGVAIGLLSFFEVGITPRPQLSNHSHRSGTQEGATSSQPPRILCLVSVHSNNVRHLDAVNDTFGCRCDKIQFYASRKPDKPKIKVNKKGKVLPPEGNYTRWTQPGALQFVKKGKPGTWIFAQEILSHAYIHLGADMDWVVMTDDKSFVIIENLREFVGDLNPDVPLYFGNRVYLSSTLGLLLPFLRKDYLNAKAGYVLSRKAVGTLMSGRGKCQSMLFPSKEDVAMSKCFQSLGVVPFDASDTQRGGHRFLPDAYRKLIPQSAKQNSQSSLFSWFSSSGSGGEQCCSDRAIVFGDLSFKDIRLLHYTVYGLRPFGSLGDRFFEELFAPKNTTQ